MEEVVDQFFFGVFLIVVDVRGNSRWAVFHTSLSLSRFDPAAASMSSSLSICPLVICLCLGCL